MANVTACQGGNWKNITATTAPRYLYVFYFEPLDRTTIAAHGMVYLHTLGLYLRR